jgi:hypothetical protein
MNKFEVGDTVQIFKSLSSIASAYTNGAIGEVVSLTFTEEFPIGVKVGNDKPLGFKPDEIQVVGAEWETIALQKAAIDAAYRVVDDLNEYAKNIRGNNYAMKEVWEERARTYEASAARLKQDLDRVLER